MNKKSNKKLWIAISIFVLMVSVIAGYILAMSSVKPQIDRSDDMTNIYNSGDDKFDGSTITIDGVTYNRNPDIKTILLLGIDKSVEEIESTNLIHEAGGRADVIALLVMNKKTKKIDVIGISRDTIVNVDVYGKDNAYIRSDNMQIALQYTVADNMKRGNWIMKNKVSEMMYDIPIYATAALTMDGISTLIDNIGGITITMDDNYKILDKQYTKGQTVKLSGEEAYKFIRYRDTKEFGSNNVRMKRHILVMRTLVSKIKGLGNTSIEILKKVAEPYMESDIDADTIQQISEFEFSDSVVMLPGDNKEGNHDEFHLDEVALRELVIKTFYTPAN